MPNLLYHTALLGLLCLNFWCWHLILTNSEIILWNKEIYKKKTISLKLLFIVCIIPALIFVVDSTDSDRLEEAYDELAGLITEKQLKDAMLLVFANKQVRRYALPSMWK